MPRGKAKELPNNIEAEASVLACCMLSDEVAREFAPQLAARDFYRASHQSVIVAMRALLSKGRSCDQVSVMDYLKAKGSKVTHSEIVSIADNSFALTAARTHLEIVRRCSLQRRIIACCAEIEAMAYDPQEDAESVRQQAVAAIMALVSEPDGAAADGPDEP